MFFIVLNSIFRIAELDKQVDDLLSFFFSTVKTGYNHPIEAKRTAARALQNMMKPYFGVQSLPQRQQVQTVDGLLKDLKKKRTRLISQLWACRKSLCIWRK